MTHVFHDIKNKKWKVSLWKRATAEIDWGRKISGPRNKSWEIWTGKSSQRLMSPILSLEPPSYSPDWKVMGGNLKAKAKLFSFLDHLSWWVWRKHDGQNTGPSKHEVMSLGNRCAERPQRNSVCSQNQKASGTSGYLPTFLQSCSRKKSFPRPFGLHQSLKFFLRHAALSGDKITSSASQMPGFSTVSCLLLTLFPMQSLLGQRKYSSFKTQP